MKHKLFLTGSLSVDGEQSPKSSAMLAYAMALVIVG